MSYILMIVNWEENRITFGGSEHYQRRQMHNFAVDSSPACIKSIVGAVSAGNRVQLRKNLEDLRGLAKLAN